MEANFKIAGFPSPVLQSIQNLSYAMADVVNVDINELVSLENIPEVKVNINRLELHVPSMSKLFPNVEMDAVDLPNIVEDIPNIHLNPPPVRIMPRKLSIAFRQVTQIMIINRIIFRN